MPTQVDFFFNFGSTYSYLSIMRLEDEAMKAGLEVRWRPFNVRKLFVEQTNIPFPRENEIGVKPQYFLKLASRSINTGASSYRINSVIQRSLV